MRAGDIVLSSLLQADGRFKVRPAVVLHETPKFGDLIVCGVSCQLEQESVGLDEILDSQQADFAGSGLKEASLIRLTFLGTVPRQFIRGRIGEIAPARLARLLTKLSDFFRPA